MFLQKADAKPSSGSAIDHIGFSFADLDAKMKEFEAAGVKIVTPARDVPGLFKLAFVEDPWGTRIEVVQDPERLGLHHVHMRGPDPEEVFSWLQAKFGGQRTKLKGRIDAIKYSAPGFSDMWILVQKGDAEPSEGHAIDHIGWRSAGAADEDDRRPARQRRDCLVRTNPAGASERFRAQLLLCGRTGRREDRTRRTARTQARRVIHSCLVFTRGKSGRAPKLSNISLARWLTSSPSNFKSRTVR